MASLKAIPSGRCLYWDKGRSRGRESLWRRTGREEKPEALLVFLKLVMTITSSLTHLTMHDPVK